VKRFKKKKRFTIIEMLSYKNYELGVVTKLNTKFVKTMKYTTLYNQLVTNYNRQGRIGLTFFEYFNSDTTVKPHFDYEEIVSKYDHLKTEEIKENFIQVANTLFNAKTEDWAISDDSRFVDVSEKTNTGKKKIVQQYKISLHFVLWTKKCNFEKFGLWVREHKSVFYDNNLIGVDLAIYRIGINKFRLPMTKKKQTDINSLLSPRNYGGITDFHKHLVQITDYCTEFEIKLSKNKQISHCDQKTQISHRNKMTKFKENSTMEINEIIKNYHIISTKHGYGTYKHNVFYDILTFECGKTHNNNHNFLIHNILQNTLKIKCHSSKCENFEKILYQEKSQTLHFDMKYLMNIPVPPDIQDNYQQIKKYFEHFFIFIRDSNSYYRKRYEYNQKYKYFELEIKPININGFSKDVFYKLINDSNNMEHQEYNFKNFYKRYQFDSQKKSYLGLCFQPYGNNTNESYCINNGDYNLFDGFNYQTVLTFGQKQEISKDINNDFEFFINYIKNFICGLCKANESQQPKQIETAKESFLYLIYFLANIIQNPTIVPHIILIFFSKTHGTGKSGFTKFISRVIGPTLSYFGSYDQIMEKHTNAHVGKLLNIIEEVDRNVSKKFHNQMKDFSQREKAVYNEKNKPQYLIKTFVRYIKTTNYQDGIWFDSEDRRYVLYTFEKIEDESSIKRLLTILDNPFIIYLFGKYLSNIKIPFSRLNEWEKHRPLSIDYFNMRSEDPITQFLKDLLKLQGICVDYLPKNEYFKHDDDNIIAISKEALYQLYIKFYDENNCMNRKYKNKLRFIKHLSITYKHELFVRKFKQYSRKDYYVIYLQRLWCIFFPDLIYINYHHITQ
jgi:hypothetical protein